jgi:hypothetical protein
VTAFSPSISRAMVGNNRRNPIRVERKEHRNARE